MCSALVSLLGLKNEVYSCAGRCFGSWIKERGKLQAKRVCFGSWIKERGIFMCSALVLAHGLKNEGIFMCSALVWLMD